MMVQYMVAFVLIASSAGPVESTEKPAAEDVVLRAMEDELARGMKKLKLDDLPTPYFIGMTAQDRTLHTVRAAYGGLLNSEERRTRYIGVRTRVGSAALDNTNVPGSRGQFSLLPLDDDYTAIRHAIWLALDQDYKSAVETLTRKIAYLAAKTDEGRPDDYSDAPVVKELQPIERVKLDKGTLEDMVKRLSTRFNQHSKIQNSSVQLVVGDSTQWVVNSEGTRVRTSDTGAMMEINAQLQAADGMPLGDSLTYLALTPEELPAEDEILADIDAMAAELVARAEGMVLEQYTGPILFEPEAAGAVFDALLAEKLCARPLPVGARWDDNSLEKKIGLRILPRSFIAYDDPGPEKFGDTLLAGSYEFDDEGVAAQRVELVETGRLQTMLASRSPTDKIKETNGHARGGGFGDPQARVGCLYLQDEDGLTEKELREELILAAKDEGLEYGLRVESMRPGRGDTLGEPIRAYKVYVEDGREEPMRGMKFLPVQTRALKRLLAAGKEREAYNTLAPVGMSIISPAILFEELELTKVEQEFDKLPILPSPLNRDGKTAMRDAVRP
jgi:predicted Zn-dependent protease